MLLRVEGKPGCQQQALECCLSFVSLEGTVQTPLGTTVLGTASGVAVGRLRGHSLRCRGCQAIWEHKQCRRATDGRAKSAAFLFSADQRAVTVSLKVSLLDGITIY